METPEDQSKKAVVRSSNGSFPAEIIDDILTRLPVKSILRFRSVSKPWLSLISDPSFTKLHFNRTTAGNRTALLISAYDSSTRKRHFLSAAHEGGPVSNLMTVDHLYDSKFNTDVDHLIHLNGLVCLICSVRVINKICAYVFVLNPSTRKIFKLPDPTNHNEYVHLGYLFGYDESRNEHKIVHIRKRIILRGLSKRKSSTIIEIMIFSMSNYSWRKINVDGFSNWDRLTFDLDGGVCVNSVVYVMLQDLSYDILTFDLKTEKLSIVSIPSHTSQSWHIYRNRPQIMRINGSLGVVFYLCYEDYNQVDIWMLQDYENHVWVRESIEFVRPKIESDVLYPIPQDVDMEDEIIFSLTKSKVSENVMIMPIYNKKSRCLKLLRFTLGHPFQCSKTMRFKSIKCYVESMLPL